MTTTLGGGGVVPSARWKMHLLLLSLSQEYTAVVEVALLLVINLQRERGELGQLLASTQYGENGVCITGISLSRYIHIKDPLRYGRWMTKRVIYSSIAAIWLLAALISFLPVSMDLHKPQDDSAPPDESFDDESNVLGSEFISDATSPLTPGALLISGEDGVETISLLNVNEMAAPQCALDLTPTYAIVSSCISFYLPCLVMLAIYSRLFFYAKMHVQNIKAVTRPVILLGRFEPDPSSAGAADAAEVPSGQQQKQKKNKKKRRQQQATSSAAGQNSYHVSDHKAAITLGIIMGVFLICWVPFFCINIVAAFCKTCIPPIVFKILTWLGYSNSAFNPIIYSIFNLDFRLAFQKILTVKTRSFCCRRFADYEQRSRGNSNGGGAALGNSGGHQPANQFRMDQLRQQQQVSNGHQQQIQHHVRAEPEGNHHILHISTPKSDDCQADPNSDDAQSNVILVSASTGHIISANNTKHPHHNIRNINSGRQDSGQHLLIAEKVVWSS